MGKVIIKKTKNKGLGVFASRNIKEGEKVTVWHPKKIISEDEMKTLPKDEQDHTTLTGDGNYIIMGEPERFVNHSCNPNTFVKDKKDIALRDIKKGEEVTSDYSINGINSWKMRCLCGSKNCRRIVYSDFFKLPKNVQKKYYPYLEDWFKKKFKNKLNKLMIGY